MRHPKTISIEACLHFQRSCVFRVEKNERPLIFLVKAFSAQGYPLWLFRHCSDSILCFEIMEQLHVISLEILVKFGSF